jgi:2-methylisocitrate lyase-like PEP mutase family enzyme
MIQSEKATFFKTQHHASQLLLLPNVWDVLSARLIASLGFRSLATASVSVSAVNGFQDGELIPFPFLLEAVSRISKAVDLPVSVDFERGFAQDLKTLSDNIKQLLDAGAIGINIEDSLMDKSGLVPVTDQCKKIEVIKKTASGYGVDLFVNARTDVYVQQRSTQLFLDTLERARAYQQAGADCFYPILMGSYDELQSLTAAVTIPVNVLLMKPIGDLRKLEQLGVKRVSLGPATLKYMLTQLRNMVTDLRQYDTDSFFKEDLISKEDFNALI